jgi:hypothetical protein
MSTSTINLDGGSLPRGNPKPIPDYREPRQTQEEKQRFAAAAENQQVDYRLACNRLMRQFGAVKNKGLAGLVDRLLRTNRELAIRLYGVPVDLDGNPITHSFINP